MPATSPATTTVTAPYHAMKSVQDSKSSANTKIMATKKQPLKAKILPATAPAAVKPKRVRPSRAKKRTIIGFVRDHSGSMSGLSYAAAKDYNAQLSDHQDLSVKNKIDTFASVIKCGGNGEGGVEVVSQHVPIAQLVKLEPHRYDTPGGTPLWDSVARMIDVLEASPFASKPTTGFLLVIVTDGEEAHSRVWNATRLAERIRKLQATDKWTFTFRVPVGYKARLVNLLGIPEGNVCEWEQSTAGMERSTVQTKSANNNYYATRTLGLNSTQTFYANLNVSAKTVEAKCVDITPQVSLWTVASAEDGAEIRPFIESRLKGSPMKKGAAFYQLTKIERNVQNYKKIVIRDKTSKALYGGDSARSLLKLPTNQNVRLNPGSHTNFDIFIQSTSVNRKLPKGTEVVYWENAAV